MFRRRRHTNIFHLQSIKNIAWNQREVLIIIVVIVKGRAEEKKTISIGIISNWKISKVKKKNKQKKS